MNFDTIANSVLGGREINEEEGLHLLRIRGREDEEIFALASRLNENLNGQRVTYVQNRNLNFTNICSLKCNFCGFCRDESHPQAFLLPAENLLRKIRETPGITEVCIQGGIHPRLEISFYVDLLRRIKEQHPSLHIHGHRPGSPSLLSFLPVSFFFTDTNIIIQQNDLTPLTNFPRSTSPDPLSPEQPHNTQPSTLPAPLFTNPHPTSQPRPHTQSLRVWGRG